MGCYHIGVLFAVSAYAARISTILKNSGSLSNSLDAADPYAWELQVNPVSRNSCYALNDRKLPALITVKDTNCVGYQESDLKCRGGFPFYRFSAGPPGCVDCMDAGRCQMLCLSKGMDAAALVLNESNTPAECRCGATRKNLSVWSLLGKEDRNFGPVHSLLPPTPQSALPVSDERCAMFVYVYKDDIPAKFVNTDMTDDYYVRQIVSGMKDPGDVEDSTVAEGQAVHKAIQTRLQLWLKRHPTNRVPRDEIFVEQVAAVTATPAPGCQDVEEPFTCWDAAVDSVLAANALTMTDTSGAYTSGYMTMMMTVPYATWLSLFGSGGSVSTGTNSMTRSGFCSSTANANQCPITCGKCQLYDRAPRTASMYSTWAASNTDAETGIVTIPVVFDTNPTLAPYLGADVVQMVADATQVWAAVTCVNFQLYEAPPTSGHYVLISADLDSTGQPSGCMADPVGLPQAAYTRISVGGCKENRKPLGSLIHEFAHVLGLVHTQMRPDRDEWITMNPMMVKPGFEPNFFLAPYAYDGTKSQPSDYDYGSIMHYTRTQAANADKYDAQSTDWSGTFKLLKSLAAGASLGQRDALSVLDISEVNSIYSCNSVLANLAHSATPRAADYVAATTVAPAVTTATPVTAAPAAWTSAPTVAPTTLAPRVPATAWEGWEEDVLGIATAIQQVIDSNDIHLSMHQLDLLQAILDEEQDLYVLFEKVVNTKVITAGWRDTITEIGNNMLGLVTDSRAGVTSFQNGTNPDQEAILDEACIASLESALSLTKVVYSKLVAYLAAIPGGLTAHDIADLAHPSGTANVLAWQSTSI